MRKITQIDHMADGCSAGAIPDQETSGMGSDVSFIGRLLRLARLRSHKAVAEKAPADTISSRRRSDSGSEVARASMEAGLTRGASVLFGGGRR